MVGGSYRLRVPPAGAQSTHRRERVRRKTSKRGYVYLHSAVEFVHRARAWFAAHGTTHIERIVADNGACYRADAFARALLGSRHQRNTPYTPGHNGKVERDNRIIAEEFLTTAGPTAEPADNHR